MTPLESAIVAASIGDILLVLGIAVLGITALGLAYQRRFDWLFWVTIGMLAAALVVLWTQ